MKILSWLLVSPLLCLALMALTALIAFLVLRRGTHSISQQTREVLESAQPAETGSDTRWARTDLAERSESVEIIDMAACPACGGENRAGATMCAYCGRNL